MHINLAMDYINNVLYNYETQVLSDSNNI